jgi:hypothetical protein
MNGPSKEAIAEAMAFVLWMGAANAAATDEQRTIMRGLIDAPLEEYVETGDQSGVRQVVSDILGPDWKPTGVWASYIAALNP